MSLNPITLIEKLIEEHGSSTIQGRHLALLRDHISILQTDEGKLSMRVKELEKENAELRSKIQGLKPSIPGDRCPFCSHASGKLKELKAHPQQLMAQMGMKIGYYNCENPDCLKEYDKQVNPR